MEWNYAASDDLIIYESVNDRSERIFVKNGTPPYTWNIIEGDPFWFDNDTKLKTTDLPNVVVYAALDACIDDCSVVIEVTDQCGQLVLASLRCPDGKWATSPSGNECVIPGEPDWVHPRENDRYNPRYERRKYQGGFKQVHRVACSQAYTCDRWSRDCGILKCGPGSVRKGNSKSFRCNQAPRCVRYDFSCQTCLYGSDWVSCRATGTEIPNAGCYCTVELAYYEWVCR
jgi:hypothetical protein